MFLISSLEDRIYLKEKKLIIFTYMFGMLYYKAKKNPIKA